ncbi:MAG: mechanosensitive ion channel family protein [Fusobacteriaceae bacterium]
MAVEEIGKTMGIYEVFKAQFLNVLPKITIRLLIITLIIFFAKKILNIFMKHYKAAAKKKNMDPLLESFLSSLIQTVYYIFVTFIVVSTAGIQATSIATLLGAAGLAIGLALQGSLSNLAGGILILFFRPFNKGDYISNNSGIDGSVEKIRILYTELITPDNKTIIVPNGQLANNAIINFSKNPERRLDLVFSVSYDTPINKVMDILSDISKEDLRIIQKPENRIGVFKHNASSVDFAFRVWVKTENYWDAYFDLNRKVKETFDANGIEIPYQKIDIYNKKIEG